MDSLRASALRLTTPDHSPLGQPMRLPPALWTTLWVAHTAHSSDDDDENKEEEQEEDLENPSYTT